MDILIRTLVRQGGQRAARERRLETERLRIGRGTDQDIEIPDLRVSLAHAEIWLGAADAPHIEARSASGVWVNGRPRARSRLRVGDVIDCGRFRMTLRPATGTGALALDIEETASLADRSLSAFDRLPTTLEQSGLSRRRLSWLLFLLVLLPGLVLPAWLRLSHDSMIHTAAPAWVSDHVWRVGTSSKAHAFFSSDCAQCHQQPFIQVRDESCLTCHARTRQHVDDPRLLAAHAFAGLRCSNCHREHRGPEALVTRSDALCTDCHARPQQDFPGSTLTPATGFSSTHPAFAPSVARFDTVTSQFRWIEARSVADQHSDTNLFFRHDVHLAPEGIRSPDGKHRLGCPSCHEPDATGVSFKPIAMETHCAACHRLDFDPSDPSRTVPHGRPALVVQTIRDYYARAALDGGVHQPGAPAVVQLRRRPGQALGHDESRAALAWADRQSTLVIDEVFDRRVCSECHFVQRAKPGLNGATSTIAPWTVAPVMLETHPLRHALFSHAAHRAEACESCHAARNSKNSEDLLLPTIARCRDCHGEGIGAVSASEHVESICLDCHTFHQAEHAVMGAESLAEAPHRSSLAATQGNRP